MTSRLKVLAAAEPSCSTGVSMNVGPDNLIQEPQKYRGRAAVVTLGCAKNQVDSEVMLGVFKNAGYEIVNDLKVADVAVVNTCGFLESAIKESIDCILEVGELKRSARLRKLLVAGCLVERYQGDLRTALPEVDAFISIDDILKVGEVAGGELHDLLHAGSRPYFLYDDSMPRFLSTKRHMAYVKISEGCDRPCTFCIIPRLRGAHRSRALDSVVREVSQLGAQGVREINLVAQDLTSFGRDQGGGSLPELLRKLDNLESIDWIRLLYAYPIGIDEELLSTISNSKRIAKYLDLPLQHASESLLKEMKRPLGRYSPRRIVEFIRAQAPSIALRTTFIVGFPGETEADVKELEAFVSEGHFSSVGVFAYSKESGTPAAELGAQIPEKEKARRRERVMLAQQRVHEQRMLAYEGKKIRVLLEGTHEDTDLLLVGRAEFQAPDVDGTVLVNDFAEGVDLADIEAGDFGLVEVTESAGYDLVGKLLSIESRRVSHDTALAASSATV
jgi:ribosomal protein S12 methylthiotransferase